MKIKVTFKFSEYGKEHYLEETMDFDIFEKKYKINLYEFIDEDYKFEKCEEFFFRFAQVCNIIKEFVSHSKVAGGTIFHIDYDEVDNKFHVLMEYNDVFCRDKTRGLKIAIYNDFIVNADPIEVYFNIEK